ncbi:hypothetical protein H4Q26_009325 [Puccinia striiformis f. sp. tritici PST-130]|nr:hypothetical protein H4Q26_009325 [Puccinia striiformis f. sp. tritici PST-130]
MSLSTSLRDGNLDKRKLFNLGNNNTFTPSSNPGSLPARSSASSTPDLSPMAPNSSYFSSRSTRPAPANPALVAQEIESLGTPSSESSKESDSLARRLQKSTPPLHASSLSNLAISGSASSSVAGGLPSGIPGLSNHAKASDAGHKHFVGTPDYLAPESILGIGMDEMVIGFLYGFPPFHDETPDKVFDNILSRRLEFPESDDDISPEAIDFMNRLMCTDPKVRLGSQVTDPESTDYFDPRGAAQVFHDEEETPVHPLAPQTPDVNTATTTSTTTTVGLAGFQFQNLPSPPWKSLIQQSTKMSLLVARDRRTILGHSISRISPSLNELMRSYSKTQGRSEWNRSKYPRHLPLGGKIGDYLHQQSPPAPVLLPHLPRNHYPDNLLHTPVDHQSNSVGCLAGNIRRSVPRNSMPSRMRRASFSGTDAVPPVPTLPRKPLHQQQRGRRVLGTTSSTLLSIGQTSNSTNSSCKSSLPPVQERTVDCLIAEDNPISSKVLETILIRFGCRCVVVPNGEDAISCAMEM